jgi:hypothetical protein
MDGQGLPRFFQDLAENWKGWSGSKEWSSLEEELKIRACSDRSGKVLLTIELRHPHAPWPWSVQGTLDLEAGQLDVIAKGMLQLYSK